MRTSVIIGAATEHDARACVTLAAKASGRPVHEWRDRLREDLARDDRLLIVARAGSRLVGYGRARRFEPDARAPADVAPAGWYLLGLFVEPDVRRSGIAHAITEMRLAWIRDHATSAWFFTNARNVASIELHRRCGFVEVTRAFSFPRLRRRGHLVPRRLRLISRRGPSASP